ncbi:sigma factor-like helix-turn-helix DNA-binding protein [Clostridioides difficile]|nr:sigma factor-like helix-turn-helix DNA-binding protein [Clostridioides difficile]MDU8899354.1 sigma factor-like helix-turn-helix DNA-binding protein [Clostridioides difficile]
MKPSDFQKTIQCQFDCKLKRVVKGVVRNYYRELRRRRKKEISYCELPEIVVEKLAVWDEYESGYTAFDVCGIEIRVLDDDLADAIKSLSEKDRAILLMYFFLGMSDGEIGDKLKINRSTSFRSRKNSLEEIRKQLKENVNDE